MALFNSKKQTEIDKLINENDELKNQLHSVLLKHESYEDLEKNLSQIRREIGELHRKEEVINKNLAEYETVKSEKERHLNDLNSKILELEEIKENLHTTIQSYNAQVSILEERSKDLDVKLDRSMEIETKLAAAAEKKEILDRDIAEKEQTFAYLSTIEREIQSELEKEKNELDEVKSKTLGIHSEIEGLNSKLEAQYQAVNEMERKEEDVSRRLSLLSGEEERKSAAVKSLEEKITLNEEIKTNLESALNNLTERLNLNEAQYSEQMEKRDRMQEELLELRKEGDDLRNRIDIAKEQFNVFQTEAAKHSRQLAELGAEIQKIELLRSELGLEINSLNEIKEKISSEIADKKNFINELELKQKSIEENRLQTEEGLNSLITKYLSDLDEARAMKDELQSEITKKMNESAGLDKILNEKSSVLAGKESELRIAARELEFAVKQNENLKKEKEDLLEKISLLRENVSKHNSQMTSLKYETESLHIKKADIQRDLAYLMTQISREYAESESKLKTLNESISSGENIYRELISRIDAAKEELENLTAGINEIKEKKEIQHSPAVNENTGQDAADNEENNEIPPLSTILPEMNDD